jgi:hypothetical protein
VAAGYTANGFDTEFAFVRINPYPEAVPRPSELGAIGVVDR